MVSAVTSSSSSLNTQSSIPEDDFDEFYALMQDVKKKYAKTTTAEIIELLIMYIIANMSANKQGGQAGEQQVENQISSVLSKFSSDMQKGNALVAQIRAVQGNPSKQTPDELSYLENLISILKDDLKSGTMDDLPSSTN